jgi:nucleoid-associated protein YgaU
MKPQELPPPLAAKYPESNAPASASWGRSMEKMLPLPETATTHRVVDGDTLDGLAQRYLGSPARAQELFDANRDVLSDPRLLPIGAELKIPRTGAAPAK